MSIRPNVQPFPSVVTATLATAAAMLVLDLAWLGIVARGLYVSALGPLMRPEAFWPAAALFYAFYVAVIVTWAVLGTERPQAAGLAVAGMPVGSPGMEVPDGAEETYDVVLFGPTGQRVYARYKGTKELKVQH